MGMPIYTTIAKFKKSECYQPNRLFESTGNTRYGDEYRSVDYETYYLGTTPREHRVYWFIHGTHSKKPALLGETRTMAELMNYYNDKVCVSWDGERIVDKRVWS